MTSFKDVGKVFVFIATGIVAIIVGAFMLRGNMHMWDKNSSNNDNDKNK
ncbi:MAG: hypothetical protein R3327_01005 [Nitrosopumilaceae archaeon]|nr:hypothetical protein [Nitrosopumilaceae archaeon]